MLRTLTRSAPLRALLRPAVAHRSLSSTARVLSSDHAEPILVGKGAPTGAVPSSIDQATGLERLQLVGEMEGTDVFDMEPLRLSRIGTMKDPIMVKSYGYPERIVGCTGYPVDSHDCQWLACHVDRSENKHRCWECGCVYSLDVGTPRPAAHH